MKYGINPNHLLKYVIEPTLQKLQLDSQSARILVLGTAMVESSLFHLKQIPNGPALGIYCCEPKTHQDLLHWLRWPQNAYLVHMLNQIVIDAFDRETNLCANLMYATAICRLDYRREKERLPAVNDVEGMASYHKRYYNSALGKTDVSKSVDHFHAAMKEVLGEHFALV